MELSFSIEGLEELDRLLAELPEDIEQRSVLKEALRTGAEIIRDAAREKCPVYHGPPDPEIRPGELRDSINVKTSTRKGSVVVRVQTGEGDFVGEQYYGGFLEFGHHMGKRTRFSRRNKFRDALDRRWVEPRPYMRPAFDENLATVEVAIRQAVRLSVEQILRERGLMPGEDST